MARFGKATAKVPDWFAALVEQFAPVASRPVAEACRRVVDRAYDG